MGKTFSERLISWQLQHGRHDLPWQSSHDPYVRWLAEIMLQQTQVKTVIPYFLKFLEHYPKVTDLAAASEEEVFQLWAGLGYYSRARNLHSCAREVVSRFQGAFPLSEEDLQSLPGIGRSTAAAIRSAVTDEPCAILDGNVKRVLSRHALIGKDVSPAVAEKQLWLLANELLPKSDGRTYAQAVMDLGATVCKRSGPMCSDCPISEDCVAFSKGLQEDFPPKRKTQPVPEVIVNVGVYLRKNKVYLTLRQESYWKGLWVLPAINGTEENGEIQPMIRHRLTHLLLKLYPVVFRTEDIPVQKEWRAFSKADVEKGALPTPIKKLLLELM